MKTEGSGYGLFADAWQSRAQLAWDTLALRAARGIPTWGMNVMQRSHLEHFSGSPPGAYARAPESVYLAFQRHAGACYLDQWIPRNPLSIGEQGYDDEAPRRATTGVPRANLETLLDGFAYYRERR